MKMLFVCTGNTCRSPMAEALIKWEAARRGLAGHEFQSAGINIADGDRASKYAVQAMADRGIDIDRRQARQINAQMVLETSVVLTMSEDQARMICRELPQFTSKVCTLGEYAGLPGDVEDPYGGSPEDYEEAARHLEELVGRVLDRVG